MKRMTCILALLLSILIMACGGGGGDTPPGDGAQDGDVQVSVSGDIYNQAVEVEGLGAPEALAVANTPNSILNATAPALANLQRFNDVSQGSRVIVETLVENRGDDVNDLTFEIGIEDALYLTLEHWGCWECFQSPDQTRCNGPGYYNSWQVEGGFFYNTVASPALPACDETVSFTVGTCHDVFFPGFDCEAPAYEIKYTPAGTGLMDISGDIGNLPAGEVFTSYFGYSHSGMDIRPNHLACFAVKDSEGNTLADKYYVFDVVP